MSPASDICAVDASPGTMKFGKAMNSVFAGITILVAEDDDVNAVVLVELLEFMGATVRHAEDGVGAVEMACEEERPDLVLMDCNMPRMDGWTATQSIRRHESQHGLSRLPIVAITAAAHESDQQRCFDVGMDECIIKPYDVNKLRSTVAAVLQRQSS
jgi:CheY-like chemotaxis protein